MNNYNSLPPALKGPQNIELLKRYAETGDEEYLDQVVAGNLRLVMYAAKKFQNTGHSLDELFSLGSFGLLKAARSFKVEKKIQFATYAATCINNEILMYLRRNKKHKAVQSLEQGIARDVEGNELTLMDTVEDGSDPLDKAFIDDDTLTEVKEAMEILSEREKELLNLYYFGNLTQTEVGEKMGFTQSYMSRLRNKALEKIKKYVARKNREEVKVSNKPKKVKGKVNQVKHTPKPAPKKVVAPKPVEELRVTKEEINVVANKYKGSLVKTEGEWKAIDLLETTRKGYKEIAEETKVEYHRVAFFGGKARSKKLRKEIQQEIARKNARALADKQRAAKAKQEVNSIIAEEAAQTNHTPVTAQGPAISDEAYEKFMDTLKVAANERPNVTLNTLRKEIEERGPVDIMIEQELSRDDIDIEYDINYNAKPKRTFELNEPSSSPQQSAGNTFAEGLDAAIAREAEAPTERPWKIGAMPTEGKPVMGPRPTFSTLYTESEEATDIAQEVAAKNKPGTINRSVYINTEVSGEEVSVDAFLYELERIQSMLEGNGSGKITFDIKVTSTSK